MGKLAHKVPYTAILEPEQLAALRELSKRTRVPMQEYLREGVDLVLRKHSKKRR